MTRHAGYRAILKKNLEAFGVDVCGSRPASSQVIALQSDCEVVELKKGGISFVMSSGCAQVVPGPELKPNVRVEFIAGGSAETADFSSRLLEYAMYFHMTWRFIHYAEGLDIGGSDPDPHGFSQVFTSVPFFLPGHVNFIEADGLDYDLVWLMPIYPEEAFFLKRRGPEVFEQRLSVSGYGFFEPRNDFSYLTAGN